LDLAARREVGGEEGEALAEGEGGDEPYSGEHDDGEQDHNVSLAAELGRGQQGGDGDYGGEHSAPGRRWSRAALPAPPRGRPATSPWEARTAKPWYSTLKVECPRRNGRMREVPLAVP